MNEHNEEKGNNRDDKEINDLRKQLLEGGFGEDTLSSIEGDSEIDDNRINDFISMFGAEGQTPLKAHDWKVYVPNSICSNPEFVGQLFGIVREETESIYVINLSQSVPFSKPIGFIGDPSLPNSVELSDEPLHRIFGHFDHGKLVFTFNSPIDWQDEGNEEIPSEGISMPLKVIEYDTVTNLFSRNSGLLESSIMLDKCAVLVGCGSVGSFAAMELARSGVGRFVLCDTDILEIHNICRHQCGFDDLGRYKVDAVKDKILNINPNAEVITYRSVIQRVPEDELRQFLGRNTVIIGGGDNRGSSDWACKLAIKTDSTFVSTCCWTRAFAGEIFYWASGKELSCYSCALGGLIDDERPEAHENYFGTEEEKETLSFEPGIAADIDFVTIIAVKLALDLLNRDNENYTPRVINYLRQYTWACNTNNPKIGGERAGIFTHPCKSPTI
ncbi:MAG: ThiF family adenylyltransferase [Anaerolineaceae bacterium]|nr:ThiF family adenylyltransferase [Anaerolineaceae bacterium]